MIEVLYKNQKFEVPEGISLLQLQKIVAGDKEGVIGALVNNVPTELTRQLYQNKSVEFVTIADQYGKSIYLNSLVLMLYKVLTDMRGGYTFIMEHAISNGYFIRILDKHGIKVPIAKGLIIKRKMMDMVAADLPFKTYHQPTSEVIKIFEQCGNLDGAELLKYVKTYYTTYYQLGDTVEFLHDGTVPSTSYLKVFDLTPYHDGFILRLPCGVGSTEVSPLVDMPKLYNTYKNNWTLEHKARLTEIAHLNGISADNLPVMITISEAIHEKNIVRIADKITAKPFVKVVLIAGPSSSGKTTFSKRLSVQLAASGVKPTALSLDNYFVDREKNPVDENGELDFESLYSLDLERLSSDLKRIINGERVETPIYDFITGKRSTDTIPICLGHNEVLVIEGTHALNPELSKSLPERSLFKVFVSALNTMSLSEHICIPADDTRLLRRIIRDYKYRGYSAEDTILRWPSVRRGEAKWIEPFQEDADEVFNSSLLFELAAVSRQAVPVLMDVPHFSAAYPVAHRLRATLRLIKPISFSDIPSTSLLREFLGGSGFRY
ncbi:MAG: nucleoside kinase [Paludibacteraceae bacterium]|nr:nucleoside kinase [Paludibacteraceae bacterium]